MVLKRKSFPTWSAGNRWKTLIGLEFINPQSTPWKSHISSKKATPSHISWCHFLRVKHSHTWVYLGRTYQIFTHWNGFFAFLHLSLYNKKINTVFREALCLSKTFVSFEFLENAGIVCVRFAKQNESCSPETGGAYFLGVFHIYRRKLFQKHGYNSSLWILSH